MLAENLVSQASTVPTAAAFAARSPIATLTSAAQPRAIAPLKSRARHSYQPLRPTRDPGATLTTAYDVGQLSGSTLFKNKISAVNRTDLFQFSVDQPSAFSLTLGRLSAGANVKLLNANGEAIATGWQSGKQTKAITTTLAAGVYYARVTAKSQSPTDYTLNFDSSPVAPEELTPAAWTVMVYMAGDTLESFGIEDFQEMAAVGSSAQVNIVVQFDRTSGLDSSFGNWTNTRRGRIAAGDTPSLSWGESVGEVNMGSASTLKDFTNWSMANYQADHYALVLWGHGDGFGVSYDDQTADSISGLELDHVLGALPQAVDLVGADACLMGMTEFAYQISDRASVFVGSQELEPGPGWEYTGFLQNLVAAPDMTAIHLGQSIVNSYNAYYSSPQGDDPGLAETLSAINLSALWTDSANSLTSAISNFAATLMSTATTLDLNIVNNARHRAANAFGDGSTPDYVDVGNLFTGLVSSVRLSAGVKAAAQTVLDAYSSAVITTFSEVAGRGTGLSIYMTSRSSNVFADSSYLAFSFAADTLWDNFLNWSGW